MRLFVTCVAFAAVLSSPAFADGDAAEGKTVFAKCAACHSLDQPKNRVGPHLVGIVGRPAAGVADYANYSDGMKKAATAGVIWDETSLAQYLVAPKAMVPGTKMMFSGLKKPADVANLIAYLKTAATK